MVLGSIIRELKRKEASLAAHKKCSHVVETVLPFLDRPQFRSFLAALRPYAYFLSHSRYASHVLQTALSLVSPIVADSEWLASDTADDSIVASIESFADTLIPHVAEFLVDACGSHIIRTLVAVLVGFPVSREGDEVHKGRAKGRQRGKPHNAKDAKESVGHEGLQAVKFRPPRQFRPLLIKMFDTIMALDSEQLYRLCHDQYASPCIQLLLEALCRADKRRVDEFCKILLGIEQPKLHAALQAAVASDSDSDSDSDSSDSDSDSSSDDQGGAGLQVFAGSKGKAKSKAAESKKSDGSGSGSDSDSSGSDSDSDSSDSDDSDSGSNHSNDEDVEPEPARPAWVVEAMEDRIGSHVVEAVFQLCSDELFAELLDVYILKSIDKRIQHPRANFVVQQCIACSRSPEQLTQLCDAMIPHFDLMFAEARDGVFWKLAEALAAASVDMQRKVVRSLMETCRRSPVCKESRRLARQHKRALKLAGVDKAEIQEQVQRVTVGAAAFVLDLNSCRSHTLGYASAMQELVNGKQDSDEEEEVVVAGSDAEGDAGSYAGSDAEDQDEAEENEDDDEEADEGEGAEDKHPADDKTSGAAAGEKKPKGTWMHILSTFHVSSVGARIFEALLKFRPQITREFIES